MFFEKLKDALRNKNFEKIEYLLEEKNNNIPSTTDAEEILKLAVDLNQLDVVKYLMQIPQKIISHHPLYQIFFNAVKNNRLEIVEYLLNCNKFELSINNIMASLYCATRNNNLRLFKFLWHRYSKNVSPENFIRIICEARMHSNLIAKNLVAISTTDELKNTKIQSTTEFLAIEAINMLSSIFLDGTKLLKNPPDDGSSLDENKRALKELIPTPQRRLTITIEYTIKEIMKISDAFSSVYRDIPSEYEELFRKIIALLVPLKIMPSTDKELNLLAEINKLLFKIDTEDFSKNDLFFLKNIFNAIKPKVEALEKPILPFIKNNPQYHFNLRPAISFNESKNDEKNITATPSLTAIPKNRCFILANTGNSKTTSSFEPEEKKICFKEF